MRLNFLISCANVIETTQLVKDHAEFIFDSKLEGSH